MAFKMVDGRLIFVRLDANIAVATIPKLIVNGFI